MVPSFVRRRTPWLDSSRLHRTCTLAAGWMVSLHLAQIAEREMVSLHLLSLLFAGISSTEGINYGYGSQPRAQRSASPTLEWIQQWEQVEDVVPQAPPQKLFVEWPNNVRVQPNQTISTGLSVERPRLVWGSEPGADYVLRWMERPCDP